MSYWSPRQLFVVCRCTSDPSLHTGVCCIHSKERAIFAPVLRFRNAELMIIPRANETFWVTLTLLTRVVMARRCFTATALDKNDALLTWFVHGSPVLQCRRRECGVLQTGYGIINVNRKRCSHFSCKTRYLYNIEGSKIPLDCKKRHGKRSYKILFIFILQDVAGYTIEGSKTPI